MPWSVYTLCVVEEQRAKKTNDAWTLKGIVLDYACRGVLQTVRVPFSALLFIFVKLWERQADDILVGCT